MGATLTHSRVAFQNGWLPQAKLAWIICSSPYMQTVLGICAHRLLALDVLVPLSLVLDHDGIPTTHGDAQKHGNDSRSVPRRRKKRNGLLEHPKGCSMLSRERSTTVQRCPCFRETFLVPILYAQKFCDRTVTVWCTPPEVLFRLPLWKSAESFLAWSLHIDSSL